MYNFILIAAILAGTAGYGAETMNVMRHSGTAVPVDLDSIVKITFREQGTEPAMDVVLVSGTTESVALDSIARVTFDTSAVSGITAPGAGREGVITGVRVYPNPMFSSTSVGVVLQRSGNLKVAVYPQDGSAPVAMLHDGFAHAGARSFAWDGTDRSGRPVPNGSYVIMIDGAMGRTAVKTLVVH